MLMDWLALLIRWSGRSSLTRRSQHEKNGSGWLDLPFVPSMLFNVLIAGRRVRRYGRDTFDAEQACPTGPSGSDSGVERAV